MPPPHWPSAAQKLGTPPGRLPAPAPLTSTALLHAQPRAAPRAPPASHPAPARAATRSCPARPGPASAAPLAGQTPPGPSGRCSAGEGSQGRPRPRGAGTRKHPASRVSRGAHAGAAQQDSGSLPPRPGGCMSGEFGRLRTRSAAAAGHPLLQPGPRGQWRLVIVGAQRAWRRGGRPTPSVLLVEASLTDTLRLRSPEWEAEGQLPFTLARGPGPEPAPPAHVRG